MKNEYAEVVLEKENGYFRSLHLTFLLVVLLVIKLMLAMPVLEERMEFISEYVTAQLGCNTFEVVDKQLFFSKLETYEVETCKGTFYFKFENGFAEPTYISNGDPLELF